MVHGRSIHQGSYIKDVRKFSAIFDSPSPPCPQVSEITDTPPPGRPHFFRLFVFQLSFDPILHWLILAISCFCIFGITKHQYTFQSFNKIKWSKLCQNAKSGEKLGFLSKYGHKCGRPHFASDPSPMSASVRFWLTPLPLCCGRPLCIAPKRLN